MELWKNTKLIAILQIYQRLANSNTTKEALKCTASIAADNIVDSISFITYCSVTRKQVSAKSGHVWLWPDLKKSNPVQP